MTDKVIYHADIQGIWKNPISTHTHIGKCRVSITLTNRWKIVQNAEKCTLFLEAIFNRQYTEKIKKKNGIGWTSTCYEMKEKEVTEWIAEDDIYYTIEYPIQECYNEST